MKLRIKVVAGASKTQISECLGETLKIQVNEPPEKGKANQSVRTVLSQALNLPINEIQIMSGITSACKTILIKGLDEKEIYNKLNRCIS